MLSLYTVVYTTFLEALAKVKKDKKRHIYCIYTVYIILLFFTSSKEQFTNEHFSVMNYLDLIIFLLFYRTNQMNDT